MAADKAAAEQRAIEYKASADALQAQLADYKARGGDLQKRLDAALAEQKAALQEAHQASLAAAEQRTRADGLEQRVQELTAEIRKLKGKKGSE
jgi:hypothetical protein